MLERNNPISSFVAYLTNRDPFTNVYGIARSLLALGTLLTLVLTDTFVLFRPAPGITDFPICQGVAGKISLFCLLSPHLLLAKWIAIVILIAVVIGWRPRFTGVLHWWVSFSFMNNVVLVDGGDQVTSVLALLLIPITLFDSRKWHWTINKAAPFVTLMPYEMYKRIVANSTLTIIRIQVAIIYLHSAVAKCVVPEWQNGTALNYWFTDPMFGFSDWLAPVVFPIINNGSTVTLLTWSIILLEFVLFAGLLANKKIWPVLLALGLFFHAGIALIHGLVSFAIAMSAALILYLRPLEKEFILPKIKSSGKIMPSKKVKMQMGEMRVIK